LPSPAGVGLIAVTRTRRPFGGRIATSSGTFALYLPYWSRSSGVRPISAATSVMWRIFALCAISISVGRLRITGVWAEIDLNDATKLGAGAFRGSLGGGRADGGR